MAHNKALQANATLRQQAERAFAAYRQIPLQLVDVDMEGSLDLASELNIRTVSELPLFRN